MTMRRKGQGVFRVRWSDGEYMAIDVCACTVQGKRVRVRVRASSKETLDLAHLH